MFPSLWNSLMKFAPVALLFGVIVLVGSSNGADDAGWLKLSGGKLDGWQKVGKWFSSTEVKLDEKNPKRLFATMGNEGDPIIVNGDTGSTNDLLTKQQFTDVEVKCEFLIAKGSNSGVKLHGLYEIQILDTGNKKELTGDSTGGIYPKAEFKPNYHHIDKGVPPKVNAAKVPGEWQSLHIIFTGPRFDAEGKKTTNAKFVKVVLNDKVIHDNVEVLTPTGHNYVKKEVAKGPVLLQGDHGPVAFRNVLIREWTKD